MARVGLPLVQRGVPAVSESVCSGDGAVHLFGDVFVTARARQVDDIIEQTPNDARLGKPAPPPGGMRAI